MKTWNRWIGRCTVAAAITCNSEMLFAQQGVPQGYNTSGNRPAPVAGAPANPSAGKPVTSNSPNPAPGFVPTNPTNPTPQGPVTRDPYADRPLSQEETAHLEQLLAYWEQSTKNIERLSCEFRLYQYNSNANFVKQLAGQAKVDITAVSTSKQSGVIRYLKPDKGLYRIDDMVTLTGKLDANKNPEMLRPETITGDYWICDGNTVHQYDRKEKVVTHFTIPKSMQGVEIFESPMPFLFGVEVKKLKERYWMRSLPAPIGSDGKPNNDIFVIEAYPKLQQDAANYDHVVIYLDRKEFLPLHLVKFNTEHDETPGDGWVDSRDHYEFVTREKNASIFKKMQEKIFNDQFIPLALPSGWKEETREYLPAGSEPLQSIQNGPAGFAGQPGAIPGATGQSPGNANQPLGGASNVPNSASRPGANALRAQ